MSAFGIGVGAAGGRNNERSDGNFMDLRRVRAFCQIPAADGGKPGAVCFDRCDGFCGADSGGRQHVLYGGADRADADYWPVLPDTGAPGVFVPETAAAASACPAAGQIQRFAGAARTVVDRTEYAGYTECKSGGPADGLTQRVQKGLKR